MEGLLEGGIGAENSFSCDAYQQEANDPLRSNPSYYYVQTTINGVTLRYETPNYFEYSVGAGDYSTLLAVADAPAYGITRGSAVNNPLPWANTFTIMAHTQAIRKFGGVEGIGMRFAPGGYRFSHEVARFPDEDCFYQDNWCYKRMWMHSSDKVVPPSP